MIIITPEAMKFIFYISVVIGTIQFVYDLFYMTEIFFPIRILILIMTVIGLSGIYNFIQTNETFYLYRTPLMLPLIAYWFYSFSTIF